MKLRITQAALATAFLILFSGCTTTITNLDEVVSLFTLDAQLHALTRYGLVYTVDSISGQTDHVGTISGYSGDFVGSAVIPAPGTLMAALLGSVFAARRRR